MIAEDDAPARASGDGWAEIKGMLFDEESKNIAAALDERGMAAPEEAGFELAGDKGEVIAEIELAWTKRKIGYMTEAQRAARAKAEGAGWRIFTSADEIDTIFGEV